MGKYMQTQDAVFSVFDSVGWKGEGIATYPAGFVGELATPCIRATLVNSGAEPSAPSTSGVLMVEIFTAWGNGPKRATQIADTLDEYFQRKTIGVSQFFLSTLGGFSQDSANKSLGRAIYQIPFSSFGAQK